MRSGAASHLHQVEGHGRLRHGDLQDGFVSRSSGAQVGHGQVTAWYGDFLL